MRMDLHIIGAFETLARPAVSTDDLLSELVSRGFTKADGILAIDKALMEDLLARTPTGELRKGHISLADEAVRT